MSATVSQMSKVKTFQSSTAVVKMTAGDDEDFDSSEEEDENRDLNVNAQTNDQSSSEQDSPNWVTKSWKCDSGFNSDVNNGTTCDSEGSNEQSEAPTEQLKKMTFDTMPKELHSLKSSVESSVKHNSALEKNSNNIESSEWKPSDLNGTNSGKPDQVESGNSEGKQPPLLHRNNHSNEFQNHDSKDKSNCHESPSRLRQNPFDRVPFLEEDHFDQNSWRSSSPVKTVSSNHQPEESKVEFFGDGMDDYPWDEDDDLLKEINESLEVEENYFSQPEGYFGFSKSEELELAIRKCKDRIVSSVKPEKREEMVEKLIQLRMKLHELKNSSEEEVEVKKILGHKFERCNGKTVSSKCEVCTGSLWSRLRSSYVCQACGFSCHSKCLHEVKRHCVSSKVKDGGSYEFDICPEQGLAAQNYRCADCKASISFSDSNEPRQCDYSGLYYCQLCHWNDLEIIPARVIHNWDFKPRKICRQSKQLLDLMRHKVTIPVQDFNPSLFSYVDELGQIKKLREEVLMMKVYFLSCRIAKELKLLKQLHERPHFVENAINYSLQDLIDTQDESLMQYLGLIHNTYTQHIRQECEICRVKGFICEFCQANEILYPFDMIAITCSKCSSVFHRDCFYKKNGDCPKCARLARLSSSSHSDVR